MAKRRIILFLSILLLVVDISVLMWVRENRGLLDPYVVRILVEKQDIAEKVKAKLDGSPGRVTKIEVNVTRDRGVPSGFKVFFHPADPSLLKPVLETLKHDKIPAKQIGSEIIAYAPFKTEKLARAALPKVAAYGFTVDVYAKVTSEQLCVVTVEVVGQASVDQVREDLKEFSVVRPDDISAVPGAAQQ